MFPIRDERQTSSFPFINYFLILLNVALFVIEISSPDVDAFITRYGFTPAGFVFFEPRSCIAILSSMFLHGGFVHIISNLWFLHIFGDNVEDTMGHFSYLFFYLFAGFAAAFSQFVLDPSSLIPMIGASGAISGVAGAYLVLYRYARIEALVPTLFGFWDVIKLPAWFFLGYWFVIQVFSGIGSIADINNNIGGIAFFAHIGGFVFGLIFAKLFARESQV